MCVSSVCDSSQTMDRTNAHDRPVTHKMSRYVIAIDFETLGGVPSENGFTDIGAAILRLNDGYLIDTFRQSASMQGYQPESRCIEEFWSKPGNAQLYKETLEAVAAATNDPFQVIATLNLWIEENVNKIALQEGKADPSDVDIIIITDNSPFDAGILKCFSKKDTLYLIGGKYRDIIDVSCVYIGMSMKPVTTKLLDSSSKTIALEGLNEKRRWNGLPELTMPVFDVKHTHNPVDDAHSMALYWAFFQTALIDCANARIIDWKIYDVTGTGKKSNQ